MEEVGLGGEGKEGIPDLAINHIEQKLPEMSGVLRKRLARRLQRFSGWGRWQ